MSLGVLNNLSAMYAENSLNNTTASLNTVLQQLSSGSRINSGADDAAGLSLVNGLQANSQALMQSQTNATEGVGLLTVADGALSQVTNLLNRAVSLATEASNGTLNASQDTAANQEYQSILSEISNIGSTTTYNQEQVFNSSTNIYTGDSSTTGASVDALNIRSLSSSNLGDTGGTMAYSSGTNNVFMDLSSASKNAAVTDSLGASTATTSIQVGYLSKGANGSAVSSTATISVGAGTSYANTAQGLINAINGSGLGLTASFGTATQAGTASVSGAGAANISGGAGTDTGIIISGAGVGTGTNGAGEVGALTLSTSGSTLTGGTVSIVGSDGKTHTLTLGLANSTDTLANLASTINNAGYGVTASVNSTGYLNGNATNDVLTFTSADSAVTVASANLTSSAGTLALSGTPTVDGAAFTNNIGNLTTSIANQAYTGGTLSIGSNALITLGTAGKTDTITDLAATINAGDYGVTATANTAGTVLTFTSANAADAFSAPTAVTVGAGTAATTTNVANQNQIGTIQFSNAAATAADVATAGNTIVIDGTTFTATAASTLTTLAAQITASNIGVSASVNAAAVGTAAIGTIMTLTSTNASSHGSTVTQNLVDATHAGTTQVQDAPSVASSAYYSVGITGSIADTTSGGGTLNVGTVADNNGSGGVATISYSDTAGQSLSNSDLSNQTDAEAALTALNSAITDVAAQDGYIGAQINTLNAVSSVLSTQSENVTSAQNAVQATDYAAATSNLSKYEILSQTGISALAQANSMSQEVTKLLQ
jgi:flagellin